MTEKARWMLEGSNGMARDADAAVALLEDKVKDHDAVAMWMLGMCCEYGMGTKKDVARAEQLYNRATEQGNFAAKLLSSELKKNNRGSGTELIFECEQNKRVSRQSNAGQDIMTWRLTLLLGRQRVWQ